LIKKEIKVPNIGGVSNVEVIEVVKSPGEQVKKDESLITLESDKASMEIPSPYEGIIERMVVKVGDKVSEGSPIAILRAQEEEAGQKEAGQKEAGQKEEPQKEEPQKEEAQEEEAEKEKPEEKQEDKKARETPPTTRLENEVHVSNEVDKVHAGPAVRRLAREFGVELSKVKGSGPKHRILKEDLQHYVKSALSEDRTREISLPNLPDIDFSQFGEIEELPLNKVKKLTAINVLRSWVRIPHVTQFGQVDITDLEEFRKMHKGEVEKQGIKLTLLVFIMKAVVAALKAFPHFNASLDASGEKLILKKYFNLGIAVDTPNGLVVPVIREVDKKGMLALAQELAQVSQAAREKGLTLANMSGSCFTISSLGGIGGTGFTPIINAPDVAILGVSKASIIPSLEKDQFIPKLILPLSLSYDHRVIDGADGARFIVYLAHCLSDIRTLLL
jgi:pyruvate dehydrogenase E2 component (dihydrolipoamide acetyltransferase)